MPMVSMLRASGAYHMARNNVLKDDGSAKAVAVSNAGQFNVNSGLQTVGVITGTGAASVNAGANDPGTVLVTPQIAQSAINMVPATLQVGNGGTGSISGNVATNGTLAFNCSIR